MASLEPLLIFSDADFIFIQFQTAIAPHPPTPTHTFFKITKYTYMSS